MMTQEKYLEAIRSLIASRSAYEVTCDHVCCDEPDSAKIAQSKDLTALCEAYPYTQKHPMHFRFVRVVDIVPRPGHEGQFTAIAKDGSTRSGFPEGIYRRLALTLHSPADYDNDLVREGKMRVTDAEKLVIQGEKRATGRIDTLVKAREKANGKS
jgi:hypothetical protein